MANVKLATDLGITIGNSHQDVYKRQEFSITAVIVGVLLDVVFGAANAYLGLRVGMTVSASIPAAVVSMLSLIHI